MQHCESSLDKPISTGHTTLFTAVFFFFFLSFQGGKDGYADTQLSFHNENNMSKHHTHAA